MHTVIAIVVPILQSFSCGCAGVFLSVSNFFLSSMLVVILI